MIPVAILIIIALLVEAILGGLALGLKLFGGENAISYISTHSSDALFILIFLAAAVYAMSKNRMILYGGVIGAIIFGVLLFVAQNPAALNMAR